MSYNREDSPGDPGSRQEQRQQPPRNLCLVLAASPLPPSHPPSHSFPPKASWFTTRNTLHCALLDDDTMMHCSKSGHWHTSGCQTQSCRAPMNSTKVIWCSTLYSYYLMSELSLFPVVGIYWLSVNGGQGAHKTPQNLQYWFSNCTYHPDHNLHTFSAILQTPQFESN